MPRAENAGGAIVSVAWSIYWTGPLPDGGDVADQEVVEFDFGCYTLLLGCCAVVVGNPDASAAYSRGEVPADYRCGLVGGSSMGDDDIHLLCTECLCKEKENRGEKFVPHYFGERLILDCAMGRRAQWRRSFIVCRCIFLIGGRNRHVRWDP